MVDVVDKHVRSRMMAGIRGKNTKPELLLRQALHARGFRFRVHDRRLAGIPDIVLPKWRTAIQVHGCFWHRHQGCPKATTPATNAAFWQAKFDANIARDKIVVERLLADGWRVLVVWECAIGRAMSEEVMNEVIEFITCSQAPKPRHLEIGAPD